MDIEGRNVQVHGYDQRFLRAERCGITDLTMRLANPKRTFAPGSALRSNSQKTGGKYTYCREAHESIVGS
jgi:hypothetical protein